MAAEDDTWRFENVVPHFKRMEDFIGTLYEPEEEDYYGKGGPLKIDTYINPLVPVWMAAGAELGYHVGDPNGLPSESFTPAHVMLNEGKRVSSYTGYIRGLEGAPSRPNFTVLRYSFADEILIDNQKRAYGVAFKRHGIAQRAYASKEVIISAGVHTSPLLLHKSGIGPLDVLAEARIPVRVELAGVGLNLAEHVVAGLTIYVNDSSLLGRIHDGPEGERELERYHESGAGLLSEASSGTLAWLVSSRAVADGQPDWPDIQIQNSHKRDGLIPAAEGQPDYLHMQVVCTRARQRGSVRLNGTAWLAGERDDQHLAVVDLAHLSDPTDVDVLVEGIRIGLAAFENTTAFREAGGAWLSDVPYPECVQHVFRSDAYWRCYISWTSTSWNHRAGTCKMGRIEDPYAVVDSKLRVIGVERLRVIDTSVMPSTPNSNNNAATMMIAEKGAAGILALYS